MESYAGIRLDDQDPKLIAAAVKLSKEAGNKAFQERKYNGNDNKDKYKHIFI